MSMNNTHRSLDIMDNTGFQWQLFAITGSGIFASSYAFFVPSIILPALSFVYWPNTLSLNKNSQVRLVGLAGSILGSLLAGPVADIFGRRQLYRFGPVALLVGAIGLSGSSAGFNNSSMSMLGWTLFWQFIIGVGIGVEWTLSAVVSAEYEFRFLINVKYN
jgi:PHS family inorganic phosphate transporter-like MFS transporter